MSLRQALARLRDLLNDTPFEPEPAAPRSRSSTRATSAGMRFDALWVAGLDAERWPAPVNPDALIPLELQRAAGCRKRRRRRAAARDYCSCNDG